MAPRQAIASAAVSREAGRRRNRLGAFLCARSRWLALAPRGDVREAGARDVAYGQLPRPSRVARHVAAATWLEAKAGERVENIAEVLAHHYATALELTRAAGHADQAAELEAQALHFLILAGEKALNLDLAAARTALQRALELAPAGHPARARLLTLLARAESHSGRNADALILF